MPQMADQIAWFDMDGSLFDFDGHLRKSLLQLAAPGEQPRLDNLNLWEAEEKYPHVKARMDLIKSVPGWWREMPPLDNGFKVFRMAQTVGFDCRILTKGPKSKALAWMEKVQCCQEHLGDKIDIAIVSSKGEVYGRVLYDDYPPYMTAWLKHRPRGMGIMPVTESNKRFEHPNVVKFDGTNLDAIEAALRRAWERNSGEPLALR
jgi:5'-nucleotidase